MKEQNLYYKWFGVCLGRSEVLRSFRLYLHAQSQGHHTIEPPHEERYRKRKILEICLQRTRQGCYCKFYEHWSRFKGNAGKLLRDRVEHIIMSFSKHIGTILN